MNSHSDLICKCISLSELASSAHELIKAVLMPLNVTENENRVSNSD